MSAPGDISASLFDLSARGKLRFTGPQATWFLGQLVTNDIESLRPGQGMEALLLKPNGKIVAPMRILGAGAEVLVDTEADLATHLESFLSSRVFTTEVEITDCSNDYALLRIIGQKADDVVTDALQRMSLPQQEHSVEQFGAGWLVRVMYPYKGVDIWVKKGHSADLVGKLVASGAMACDTDLYRTIETAFGTPRFGVDYDETFLPQEAAMEKGVHFEKGCYLGQEAVAMAQRGKIRRRLRHLKFDDAHTTGEVVFGSQALGVVTSAVSFQGKGSGIGAISTSVPIGSRVQVAGTAWASVEELPGTNYGPERPSARKLREQIQGQA